MQIAVFPTSLGWFALAGRGGALVQLAFGHATPGDAAGALGLAVACAGGEWHTELVDRLKRYAAGGVDDFCDVELALPPKTPFQLRVIAACRRIPFGQTRTYAELAGLAGSPGAARAVGNIMATNCVPLVVPCHRVVGSGGSLGGYSGARGLDTKRELLALEAAALARR